MKVRYGLITKAGEPRKGGPAEMPYNVWKKGEKARKVWRREHRKKLGLASQRERTGKLAPGRKSRGAKVGRKVEKKASKKVLKGVVRSAEKKVGKSLLKTAGKKAGKFILKMAGPVGIVATAAFFVSDWITDGFEEAVWGLIW
jgi:hypothetical protein